MKFFNTMRSINVTIHADSDDIEVATIKALGGDVPQHARIYAWPLDQRPRTDDGKHGSLHAKIALADGQTMLISSANLTQYAMTLNMEMGILVHGGPLPSQVERHFTRLVEQGAFELV